MSLLGWMAKSHLSCSAPDRTKATLWKTEFKGNPDVFKYVLRASDGKYKNWYLQASADSVMRTNNNGMVYLARHMILEQNPKTTEVWSFVQLSK
jgi:hypothetical protein